MKVQVPAERIEVEEVDKRSAESGQDGKAQGLSARQGAFQCHSAAVRRKSGRKCWARSCRSSYTEALGEQEQLTPAGGPEIQAERSRGQGKDLEYTAVFRGLPRDQNSKGVDKIKVKLTRLVPTSPTRM